MHELYELKEMLCKELKDYGTKGELSSGSLETIDKLAHAIKNIDKIIDAYEDDGYSNRYPYSYRRSYARDGHSYRRDSMGRYSRDGYSRDSGSFVEDLRDLMHDAPNEQAKMKLQKLIESVE